ncbi:hypothetical protein TcYC6_0026190 [Trypanosoma cruzi]|nr:hypothetical protein TcYC6_0026190 [Trypanosoma cruzi]
MQRRSKTISRVQHPCGQELAKFLQAADSSGLFGVQCVNTQTDIDRECSDSHHSQSETKIWTTTCDAAAARKRSAECSTRVGKSSRNSSKQRISGLFGVQCVNTQTDIDRECPLTPTIHNRKQKFGPQRVMQQPLENDQPSAAPCGQELAKFLQAADSSGLFGVQCVNTQTDIDRECSDSHHSQSETKFGPQRVMQQPLENDQPSAAPCGQELAKFLQAADNSGLFGVQCVNTQTDIDRECL